MAVLTVLELSAMLVVVTVRTVSRQAEVRVLHRLRALLPDIRRVDVFRAVTFPTADSPVLALEQKTRLPVIELLGLPPYQLESSPVVLLVTLRAFQLARIEMISPLLLHAAANLTMAIEAVLPETLLTEIVAFRTVLHALEVAVRSRQLSR